MERNIKIRGIGKISNRKRWEGRRSPVGTTKLWKQRRNNDERMFIKIGNGYVLLARHNWKKVHGSIPEGHVIRRIDQTKHDYSVENLECISWAEQSRRNFEHNDEWFAGCIAHGDQKLKKFLLENKDMLKIYRLNSKLRKEIKNARKQAS